jgi:hypothetical protein
MVKQKNGIHFDLWKNMMKILRVILNVSKTLYLIIFQENVEIENRKAVRELRHF